MPIYNFYSKRLIYFKGVGGAVLLIIVIISLAVYVFVLKKDFKSERNYMGRPSMYEQQTLTSSIGNGTIAPGTMFRRQIESGTRF